MSWFNRQVKQLNLERKTTSYQKKKNGQKCCKQERFNLIGLFKMFFYFRLSYVPEIGVSGKLAQIGVNND